MLGLYNVHDTPHAYRSYSSPTPYPDDKTPHPSYNRELHLLYPKLLAGCPHVVESEFRPRARVPIIYMQNVNGVRASGCCVLYVGLSIRPAIYSTPTAQPHPQQPTPIPSP